MQMRRPASVLRRKKKSTTSSAPPEPEKIAEPEYRVRPTSSSSKMTSFKMDDIVKLNVGGQRFDTRLRTLLADRSNELYAHFVVLLEGDLTEGKMPPRDGDGNVLLDRDPDHFRTLLNNLRFYVQLQAKQKVANGTNGVIEAEEDIRSTKSVGFIGRLLKN
ncbi:hypothetical protein PMAYCL1PPCAC_02607 [Pristionchus mayeri]|uniref:Potassium channel tetramerisation-type BTB domain-containing protein n=1 Tax=Pristionchus mayeri TaxID=1317129 RepID=A0AAN4Z6T9_9BILA|nr:hypothetical protein PMAYCL1PPCAC_02607 [Pristionchus mayeri]